MRAAIMQPYFFPYIGHFSLIASCDLWLAFDISQYTPRSWMNRNRVLHPAGGVQYVTVPLSHSSIHMRTWEAAVHAPDAARRSVLGKLSHYRRHAPYYDAVVSLVNEAFENAATSLVQLNVAALCAVCRYLAIPFNARICSTLLLDLPSKMGPGDWAPAICSGLGITDYINPIGGACLFDPAEFQRRGITLRYLSPPTFHYRTRSLAYSPDLSILDVLMWNDPSEAAAYVRSTSHPGCFIHPTLVPGGNRPMRADEGQLACSPLMQDVP